MRDGVVWLAAFLLPALTGAPLLAHPAFRRFPPFSRATLAAGVGGFLVSVVMTVWALAGIPWTMPLVLAAAAGLAALLRLAVRGEVAASPPEREPLSAPVAAARVVMLVAVIAASIGAFVGAETSGDLLLFWGPKARAFAEARTVDAAFLKAPYLGYLHPSYPPLVTELFAFATMATGRLPWNAATATFPAILAALALGLPGVLRTGLSAARATAVAALAVAVIGLAGAAGDIAGNGEMPLLFYETLAMALLLSPAARERSVQLLAGLLLAGAASAKVEGGIFVVAAAVLFMALRRDARPVGSVLARLLGPTAIALGFWFAFGVSSGLFSGYRGYGSFGKLYWDELPGIVLWIARSLWAYGCWALPWLVPLAVLLIGGRVGRLAALPLGASAALCAFFVFTYLHQANPAEWIGWSAVRIFSTVAVMLTLATVAQPAGAGR